MRQLVRDSTQVNTGFRGHAGMLDLSTQRDAKWFSGLSHQEREIFIDSLLVRVHVIIEMSRPALRHGSLNSLFQVAWKSMGSGRKVKYRVREKGEIWGQGER